MTIIDPRIRSWLDDPAREVTATPDEQPALAVMALEGTREVVPRARLVVLVADDADQRRWLCCLTDQGVAATPDAGDAVADARVLAFDPSLLLALDRSPEELWVDDGVLENSDRMMAGGAWQLRFGRGPSPSARVARPALPREVHAVQRWLVRSLAPQPLAVEHSEEVLRAAALLDTVPDQVQRGGRHLQHTDTQLLMWSLEQRRVAGTELSDADGTEAPGWALLSLGDEDIQVLADAMFVFEWGGVRAVVRCAANGEASFHVKLYTVGPEPVALLQDVLDHARGPGNPYRGRVVEVRVAGGRGTEGLGIDTVQLHGLPVPAADRSELVLDEPTWRELDVNIGGLFARTDLLERLGLGTNRGVLLEGPPGVGKTHAVRVVVSELAGEVTVLLVPSGVGEHLAAVYEYARLLSPTLVVIEDIDLVAGTSRGSGARMHALLEALDGVMTQHGQVVTLATTNRAAEMDASVRRAARFDRVIAFGAPPQAGRRRILERYLAPVGTDHIDVDRLASTSEGATGADLREVVRHAVLESDGGLTTEGLVAAVRARGLYAASGASYL